MAVGRLGHEARPTAPYTEEVWQELLAAGDRADEALLVARHPAHRRRRAHVQLARTRRAPGVEQRRPRADQIAARRAPHVGAAPPPRPGRRGHARARASTTRAKACRAGPSTCAAARDGRPVWHDLRTEASRKRRRRRTGASRGQTRARARAGLGLAGFVRARLRRSVALPARGSGPADRRRSARGRSRRSEERSGSRACSTAASAAVVGLRAAAREGSTDAGRASAGSSGAGSSSSCPAIRRSACAFRCARSGRRPLPTRPPWDPAVESARSPRDHRGRRGSAARGFRPRERGRDRAHERHAACARRSTSSRATAKCGSSCRRVDTFADFFELVALVDRTQSALGIDVSLEGYPPPPGPGVYRFAVTPDPGRARGQPAADQGLARARRRCSTRSSTRALHAGLHAEKYLLDGRQAGSGGGHHITLGGPTPLESPFIKRPDLLASLLTFAQHHPSLSYMFTGLFVGPTSQAPRVDEARHDSLYELETCARPRLRTRSDAPLAGDSVHRGSATCSSATCSSTSRATRTAPRSRIDKLFDPQTPHGRQGLVELRAFEMPPHARMASAQVMLVRALVASFADKPYRAPLVRWGAEPARSLSPAVVPVARLRGRARAPAGARPSAPPRPLTARSSSCAARSPGSSRPATSRVEVRNALEPWHVLGEEMTAGGTSRYVDSSMERIEVRADGLVPSATCSLVNGHVLPLRPTHIAGEDAWAASASARGRRRTACTRTSASTIRSASTCSTPGASARIGAAAYHVWHPEGRGYEAAAAHALRGHRPPRAAVHRGGPDRVARERAAHLRPPGSAVHPRSPSSSP